MAGEGHRNGGDRQVGNGKEKAEARSRLVAVHAKSHYYSNWTTW